jgi:hypothetical protein
MTRSAARAIRVWAAFAFAIVVTAPAFAFDSKGHLVIEALAYRTLAEGHDGQPPRPDVLRDLINDGALEPPFCFGRDGSPPEPCVEVATRNPLLDWPQPLTDRPDAAFRRQFSNPGQCFHFMATLADAQTEPLPGTSIPRALAVNAVVRCNDLLDQLIRQIVVKGGSAARLSSYGLYELMHAVGDSFSGSHSERTPDGKIGYLRVWQPIERLARLPMERSARIPAIVYHKWNDHRDKTYVLEGGPADCEKRTNAPYDVPYECLSPEGDSARRALAELLVVTRDLRAAQLAAPKDTDTEPERSEAWRAYKAKWFSAAHPCEGAACAERQPPDPPTGAYALLGLDSSWNPTRHFTDISARGILLKYAWDLNPFLYALSANVGYRQYTDGGGGAGLVGLGVDLVLPVGNRLTIGLQPVGIRDTFGGDRSGPELVSRLFRFNYQLKDRLFLTFDAPIEVNWLRPTVEWTFGLGITYSPPSDRLARGRELLEAQATSERRDETWVPPPAPYGHLGGRSASWYVIAGMTVDSTPDIAVEGRHYGHGLIGGELAWDRDRWGGRFAWVPAVSLGVGSRRTSGDSAYFTGTFAASLRWYALGPLGLALTPVRVEYGPKVSGKSEIDSTPGVHGSADNPYYFSAGSRLGVVLNVGIVDILVEGPTLAWESSPFAANEILTIRVGFRLR